MLRRIVAGLLTLVFAVALVGPAQAYSYRGQQDGQSTGPTATGQAIAWHQRQVTMGLNFGPQWNDSARLALQQWNEAGADFQWDANSYSAQPCVYDNINSTGWSDSSCSGDWGSVIATTRVSMSRIGGTWYITDTDVVFNSRLQYDTYAGPQRYDANGQPVYDFVRVALHEFGHAAGLLHPDEAGQQVDAIMNTGHRSLALDHLQDDDIQGLRRLYSDAREERDIVFDGYNGYEIVDTRIHIDLDTLRSYRQTRSGELILEIRASAAGNSEDYYLLGSIELGRLPAGAERRLNRLSSAYTPPPAGLHGISLALVESGQAAPLYRQAIGYMETRSDSFDSNAQLAQTSPTPATGGDGGGGSTGLGLLLAAALGLGRRRG